MARPSYKHLEIAATYRYLSFVVPQESAATYVYMSGVAPIFEKEKTVPKVEAVIQQIIALDREIVEGKPLHRHQLLREEIACWEQVLADIRIGRLSVPARVLSFTDEE